VQHRASKRILSTQGHAFRARDAFSGRMLMQHTLSDVVVRSCDDESERAAEAELHGLQQEAWALEAEAAALRAQLAAELSRLLAQIGAGKANATAGEAAPQRAAFAVTPGGGALGALFSAK